MRLFITMTFAPIFRNFKRIVSKVAVEKGGTPEQVGLEGVEQNIGCRVQEDPEQGKRNLRKVGEIRALEYAGRRVYSGKEYA